MKKIFLFLPMLLLMSCNRQPQTTNKTTINIPSFNADSAYQYVSKQVKFGPRVPGSEAHERCLEYYVKTLSQWCDTIIINQGNVQLYDGKSMCCKNVVASFAPEKVSRIMICSHWDSRPYSDAEEDEKLWNKPIDGADDGASGVGIIMEMARVFATNKPNVGIDFILFDVEDLGTPEFYKGKEVENSWCLGSQYWSSNPHKRNYRARYGILLDMVGGENATFYREQVSTHFAPHIVNKVWNEAKTLGYESYFINETGGAITDDHLYVNQMAEIPCIDIICHNNRTGFPPYWHTQQDDMRNISRQTLHTVGQTLLNVIYKEK